ncbi:hypothetical protein PSTG_09799 [Puccinia striiformis f. sp. tritici PST-78]|uniref:Uncharacterized protein n=1 Tax=Puccinia striiformis f. sp. tritici PST-78 TaxID=1165861 RepID=A0A0L0VCB8_9BASI|nr:hypothetical protein PSTG_09799 [Puccinia striiformis f. sp. tritici PST-78]
MSNLFLQWLNTVQTVGLSLMLDYLVVCLALTCGQDSVIVVCSSYQKVHQLKYQPGTSITDHIAKFKNAYTQLIDQTTNHMPEFGTVTSFQGAALFLDSLDNDTNLTPIIQTCYDISPFDLKNVTYRVFQSYAPNKSC